MKAEGSAQSSISINQKIKVREETKECNYHQSDSNTPNSDCQVPTTMTIPVVGVVTTLTTTTSSTATTVTTTVKPSLSNHLPSIVSNSSSNEATSPTSSHQSSSVICQLSSSTSSLHNASEPVDLDIKNKAATSSNNQSSDRESDSTAKENHSQPTNLKSKLQQSSTVNGQAEFSRQLSATSSSDNGSPSHSIKPEDEASGKHEEPPSGPPPQLSTETTSSSNSNGVALNGSGGGGGGSGLRCISSVFAGHAKLKRLLGTLVQFANNISAETGDTVRGLVLALLGGGMTAEEFHSALQEATNFPLRDFVLPYLRHALPSLRRNLNNAARASNQSCAQYLRVNESAILETVSLTPSSEAVEPFGDHSTNSTPTNYSLRSTTSSSSSSIQHNASSLHHYTGPTNLATKRRASDGPYYENGAEDTSIYGKRTNNPWNHHPSHHQQQTDPYCWYNPLHSPASGIQGHLPPNLVQINQLSSFGPPHPAPPPQQHQQQQINHTPGQMQNGSSLDDEWKNIHVMLNCILGMVEKTKRALVILQRRGCSSPAGVTTTTTATATGATPASGLGCTQNGTSNGNNLSGTNGTQIEPPPASLPAGGDRDGNLKRLSGEIVAQTIRATEDRVAAEVKRRAEEAVQEVKRVAMAEVQRAVAAAVAESRASERMRVQHLLDLPLGPRGHGSVRQTSFLRVGHNTVDTSAKTGSNADDEKEGVHLNVMGSSCWNCGRPALETCGGCGIARYCGSFCQHRDWETGGHHATCRSSPIQEQCRSTSRSPPRIGSSTNEADGPTVSVAKGK